MDLGLRDKVVLISGSSKGIGRSIALGFAQEKAKVVITGRDEGVVHGTVKAIEDLCGFDSAFGFAGDLTENKCIESCVNSVHQRWGKLDIVIANLGSGKGERGWDVGDKDWDRLMELNFLSGMKIVRQTIPLLKKNAGSNIIFISSIAGMENLGAPPAYEAAKSAVISYSKYLATTLAKESIRVNVIAPGNIIFPGSTWDEKIQKDPDGVARLIESDVPMNRMGTPGEVANAVLFLASNKAEFITGACLVVDGGQTRSLV